MAEEKNPNRCEYEIPVCFGCGLPQTSVVRKGSSCMCKQDHGYKWVEVLAKEDQPEIPDCKIVLPVGPNRFFED